MSDKSPRHTASKKSGKTIKEKRAEKKASHVEVSDVEKLAHPKKK
ncbi:MAG: hypothetical protein JWO93_997 [Micrococcaceae bacterium]|jgi:hypothetical protein|nr:hypothetical protein [Micrococcaceae bacterium]